MHKPVLAAAGSIAALLLSVAPGATAQAGAVKTTVHLNGQVMIGGSGTTAFFKGHLSSRNDACLKGRKVTLRSKADDFTYGTDKTDRQGTFKIVVAGSAPVPSDMKLTASVKATKAGQVRCGADSDTEMLIFAARLGRTS